MSTRLTFTRPDYQANVLDWIPAQYHRLIKAKTSTQDVSSEVEAAINECGDYELVFPPGRYGMAAQATATNAATILGRGATLRALGSIDGTGLAGTGDGRGSMLWFHLLGPRITGLAFDTNHQNANGLYVSRESGVRVTSCGFTNIKAGYAGFRGGSLLYCAVDLCSFSGSGRSLDLQKGWEWGIVMAGNPNLTFVNVGGTGDTCTRDAGSWITDGFQIGDTVRFENAPLNNFVTGVLTNVTATVLTFGSTALTNEGPISGVRVIVTGGSYYGFHASYCTRSQFYANEGCRWNGGSIMLGCNHEHAVNQPAYYNEDPALATAPIGACIKLGEEISTAHASHHLTLDRMYTELAQGTATELKGIHLSYGHALTLLGGELRGAAGAADVDSVGVTGGGYAIYGGGTLIQSWDHAFEGAYLGNARDHILTDFSQFHITEQENIFRAGASGVFEDQPHVPGNYSYRYFDASLGMFTSYGERKAIVSMDPAASGTNRIDLGQASVFNLAPAAPETVDYTYIYDKDTDASWGSAANTAYAGMRFTLTFTNGNCTLDNATWNLLGAADRTFAAGESLDFLVHGDGTIHEVGYVDYL
jgi:hypothetical protein